MKTVVRATIKTYFINAGISILSTWLCIVNINQEFSFCLLSCAPTADQSQCARHYFHTEKKPVSGKSYYKQDNICIITGTLWLLFSFTS